MEAAQVGGAWIGDNMRYLPLVDGSLVHGNLVNHGNGDSNGSSKLETSHLSPSFSTNDTSVSHIPSVLGSLQSPAAPPCLPSTEHPRLRRQAQASVVTMPLLASEQILAQ